MGFLSNMHGMQERGCGAVGLMLGKRPFIPLFITFIVTIALAIGMLAVGIKTNLNVLATLVPTSDPWPAQDAFYTNEFSAGFARTEYISLYSKTANGNVATWEGINEMLTLVTSIESAVNFKYNGVTYYKEQLCSRTNAPASTFGIFASATVLIGGTYYPAIGLPCSRYSAIDCFYDGSYDYYRGNMKSLLSAFYFPYTDTNGAPQHAYVPFFDLGVPDSFFNGTSGVISKPKFSSFSNNAAGNAAILDLLSPSCTVWADVLVPPGILFGGSERDANGKLTSVKSFLYAFFMNDVPLLAAELQFNNCSTVSGLLPALQQALGLCLSADTSDPSVVPGCVLNSYLAYANMKNTCYPKGLADSYWLDQATAIILGYEDAFLAYMDAQDAAQAANPGAMLRFHYLAGRSSGDVAASAISGDLSLIIIGYAVAFAYAIFILARWHARWSKVLVMFGGILLLLLAIGATFGICTFAGILLTIQIIQVLPFLTIGLGLTDMFIMMYAFRYDPKKSLPEMAAAALQEVGPSHLMTSTTSVVIFGIGMSADVPVVTSFCEAALIAIIITYIVVLFGFLPILVIDGRRIMAHRSDCLPCISHEIDVTTVEPRDRLRMAKFMASVKARMPVRIGIVAGFLVMLVLCALNIQTIGNTTLGMPATQFVPKDSYVTDFLNDLQNWYTSYPHSLITGADKDGNFVQMDYPNALLPLMQLENNICNTVEHIDLTQNFTSSWVYKYWVWTNENNASTTGDCALPYQCANLVTNDCSYTFAQIGVSGAPCLPNPAVFYLPFSGINAFFAGGNAPELTQVNATIDPTYGSITNIQSSTFGFLSYNTQDEPTWVNFILQLRAATDASGLPVFADGWAFDFYTLDLGAEGRMSSIVGFMVLGVLLTTTVFLLNPIAAFIMVFHIVMMMVEVYGLMSQFQVYLNPVSMANMIMGTAIGVTFTGYITKAFMRVQGQNRTERSTSAYLSVGPPVLHGALGIFLAVVTLAVTALPYFATYFFGMYVLIVFIGIGNGLICLPAVLSFIGPAPTGENQTAMNDNTTVTKYTPQIDGGETNGNGAGNGTGTGTGTGTLEYGAQPQSVSPVVELGAASGVGADVPGAPA